MGERGVESDAADRRLFVSGELIDMIENRPPVYKPRLAGLLVKPSQFDAGGSDETTAWVVTELSVGLAGPPPESEPHPETTPVGPFASREAADEWASAHVGRFGSGSWAVAPLRPPSRDIPPAETEVQP